MKHARLTSIQLPPTLALFVCAGLLLCGCGFEPLPDQPDPSSKTQIVPPNPTNTATIAQPNSLPPIPSVPTPWVEWTSVPSQATQQHDDVLAQTCAPQGADVYCLDATKTSQVRLPVAVPGQVTSLAISNNRQRIASMRQTKSQGTVIEVAEAPFTQLPVSLSVLPSQPNTTYRMTFVNERLYVHGGGSLWDEFQDPDSLRQSLKHRDMSIPKALDRVFVFDIGIMLGFSAPHWHLGDKSWNTWQSWSSPSVHPQTPATSGLVASDGQGIAWVSSVSSAQSGALTISDFRLIWACQVEPQHANTRWQSLSLHQPPQHLFWLPGSGSERRLVLLFPQTIASVSRSSGAYRLHWQPTPHIHIPALDGGSVEPNLLWIRNSLHHRWLGQLLSPPPATCP